MHQVLLTDGTLRAEAPVDVPTTRELYAAMVAARTYDHKGTALQKQGRLATYASFLGQEACQIGATGPLRPDDWLVATYRDAGAMWAQGYPWVNLFLGRTGDERGGAAPADVNVLPPSITVGAHMIHAVGLAWAEQYRGTDRVALTMFGDGATSEGDFHEAMNFAGVFGVPVIFLCQNNHYAISTPLHRQTAAETLAAKADGYGMPGHQVDGNDLFAVYDAVANAVADARAGRGPAFIEAVTYRISPHTTADDPGRYRPAAEEEEWRSRDPLDRVRRYLEANGEWSPAWQEELEQAAAADVDAAIAAAEELDPLDPPAVFSAVFSEPTSQLLRQQRRAGRHE